MNALALQILAALAIVAGAIGAHELDKHRAVGQAFKAGQAEVNARWTAERAAQLAAAVKATADSQAEDRRRTDAQREINDEHERLQARSAVAAAAARDAVGRLRERTAALAAGAAGGQLPADPAASREREEASAIGAVLDDLAERHRQLGLEADQAAAAADDCAARYESLTVRTP